MQKKSSKIAFKKNHGQLKIIAWGDVVIILLLMLSAVFSIPLLHTNKPSLVVIYRDKDIYAQYPLGEDKTFSVKGYKDGSLTVKIHNQKVSILHSTCDHQICVKSGAIGRSAQQLICAPNHVLIEIQANFEQDSLDAIAR